jgi:hypothetical protein
MIEMMANMMMQIIMTTLWLSFKVVQWTVQLVGGYLLGRVRTGNGQAGYTPQQLTDPIDEATLPTQAYVISLPRAALWQADHTLRFVTGLLTLGRVLLQIVAEAGSVVFRVVYVDGVAPDTIEKLLYAFYPEGVVHRVPYLPEIVAAPYTVMAVPLIQANMYPAPGMTVDQVRYFDPLTTFTQALSHLQAGERVIYTVAVLADAPGANEAGLKLVTVSDIHPLAYTSLEGIYIAEMRKSQGFDRIPRFEWDMQRILQGKLNHPLYHVLVFLHVYTPTLPRAQQLVTDLLAHLMQFANPPFNMLVPPQRGYEDAIYIETIPTEDPVRLKWLGNILLFVYGWTSGKRPKTSWYPLVNVLQAEEIAALWHLPYAGFTAPTLEWLSARNVPLPKAVRDLTRGLEIGINQSGGHTQPVYLPDEDRTSHIAIIGKTGTGKSTLLHRLIASDIARGRGVCVIDPHGHLIQSVLRTSIPPERHRDVVILDMQQRVDGEQYPPPLNLLARPAGVAGDIAVGMLMSILSKIYTGFGETQMAHTLHMALLTLAVADQPTLLDVARVFEDADFRADLLQRTDNLVVQRFWASFLSKSPAQQEQMLYPVLRRLDGFYNNSALLTMTCHPNPLNFAELIQHNKILLVSLAADEAQIPTLERLLLGSVLVSQIQMAAMSGAIRQAPYLLYIDEAQHFVTTALSKMLSEARKQGLGVVLANQYLHQLAGDTLEALEGNVGAFFAFEVGEQDARALALYMRPSFEAADLVALGKYRAAVSLRVQGSRQPAFSLMTLPLPDDLHTPARLKDELYLRRISVARFTPKRYTEVRQLLNERYAPQPPHTTSSSPKGGSDDFLEPYN